MTLYILMFLDVVVGYHELFTGLVKWVVSHAIEDKFLVRHYAIEIVVTILVKVALLHMAEKRFLIRNYIDIADLILLIRHYDIEIVVMILAKGALLHMAEKRFLISHYIEIVDDLIVQCMMQNVIKIMMMKEIIISSMR